MIRIIFLLSLFGAVAWLAKKFLFNKKGPLILEKYSIRPGTKVSKKDLGTLMSYMQRWKREGKISREEYDHLTDICLAEMQQISEKENPEPL